MTTDITRQFKHALETLPHMKTQHPEVELRFGFIDNETRNFQSHIPKELFDHILMIFHSGKKWSHKSCTKSVDYYRGNIRVTHDKNNNPYCIQKVRLGSSDIKNTHVDLRLSICTESPIHLPEDVDPTQELRDQNFDTIREKVRYTFHYKELWKYDFTIVNDSIYEIEVELLHPRESLKKYTVQYLSESITLKVGDIIKMVDEYTAHTSKT